MAKRGIPEDEIFQAADALLAAGERPTTDKVRAALGRGSPNSVAPVLERWWTQVAGRLHRRLTLPDVPEAVGAAFAQAWEVALAAGQAHAEALVAPERAALAQVLATADAAAAAQQAREREVALQLEAAQAATHAAQTALAESHQRVADLRREIATLTTSLTELGRQREAAEARLLAALAQAEQDRAAAAVEREKLQTHLRHVEDRAYSEVDRTRQDLKALKAQLAAQARDHAAALRNHEQARRLSEAALQRAQRDQAGLQRRLDAVLARAAVPSAPVRRASRTRKPAA